MWVSNVTRRAPPRLSDTRPTARVFYTAKLSSRTQVQCPLWVISEHFPMQSSCPLYPQKRTFFGSVEMSAKGQKSSLYDNVCSREQRRGDCEPEYFGSFQIYDQLIFGRRLHWQVGRFLAPKNAIDIARRAAILVGFIGSVGCEAASRDK